MPNDPGVTDGTSPTVPEDVLADSSPAQAVSADPAPVADRTPEQMFRELQRKIEQQAKTQEQMLQYLQAVNTPQAPPQPRQTKQDLSDEDLWAAAQQGDRAAFELYQARIAERTFEAKQTTQSRAGIVDRQLAALKTRYPVLNDGTHELTQAVNAAYRLYLSSGYPANKETLLQAATAAIADNPEMVASLQAAPTVAREVSRQHTVDRARAGNTGVTHRREPAPPGKKPPTPEEERLAQRMGVKDAQKAKENFWKRNADGRSAISPTVAAALGDVQEF